MLYLLGTQIRYDRYVILGVNKVGQKMKVSVGVFVLLLLSACAPASRDVSGVQIRGYAGEIKKARDQTEVELERLKETNQKLEQLISELEGASAKSQKSLEECRAQARRGGVRVNLKDNIN